jgi:hypothetical protein
MLLVTDPNNRPSLELIEGGLTLIAFGLAFAGPRIGAAWFSRIERVFGRFAQRKGLAVISVGLTAFFLRLAILPACPIPLPFVPDDFSFLLAADTFAHGRLTNPTPAMWTHFETIHICMQPTYMSMYFPAQGLLLAASKVLLGHTWYGLLVMSALMCASICWMLQAWLPASWALLGGMFAVIHLGLFSYWINTYHAAGSIGAFGGALILGALPRFFKTPRLAYSLPMGAGIAILGITRPYECVLLCLPVTVALARWLMAGNNRPPAQRLYRLAAAPILVVVATAAWLGYYDYRAFGNPLTLPYTVNRATYAMAPYYVWQKPRPEPHYRHQAMRSFYYVGELKGLDSFRTVPGAIGETLKKILRAMLFFGGIAFLPIAFMLPRVLSDRRIRFLVICMVVLMAGMAIEIFLLPHYLAPFTAVLYAVGLQAMRHIRVWKPGKQPVGRMLVRLTVMVCVVVAGLRLLASPLHIPISEWPASGWNFSWYGPDYFGTERLLVESRLENLPGNQLAIVRYNSWHNPFNEWVYNKADIDASKVVWAREMDEKDNKELIDYYPDRKVWLVEPDSPSVTVSSYTEPEQRSSISH